MTCHTVWMHIRLKHHLSGPSSMSRSFELLQLASIRTFQQPIRTTLSVRPKLQDFFPKHRYGKIAATVRTTWIPGWTHSSIRQVSQFKSKRLNASQHGPKERASEMEIACIRSAVRMTILPVRTREASIWKLLAADVRTSRWCGLPSGQCSQTGKIFSEILRISVAQLLVQTANVHHPDDAQFYQARRSFELLAYK
jgi:hypothetical protein